MNSLIRKVLADKKRIRIAVAVFVPLCFAIVGATLAMSAMPARAETVVSTTSTQVPHSPAPLGYQVPTTSQFPLARRIFFSNTLRLVGGCWPITSNSATGWGYPSIYSAFNTIFRLRDNTSTSSTSTTGSEWAAMCLYEQLPAPDPVTLFQMSSASRNDRASSLAYSLATADFGKLTFDQCMFFLGISEESGGTATRGLAASKRPSVHEQLNSVWIKDLERFHFLQYVLWLYEYSYQMSPNFPSTMLPPSSISTTTWQSGFTGALSTFRLAERILGTYPQTSENRGHFNSVRAHVTNTTDRTRIGYGSTTSPKSFTASFIHAVNMVNGMMTQYNLNKTTSMNMAYNTLTYKLSYSHDGFVPSNSTNDYTVTSSTPRDISNYYRTTLSWPAQAGVTVTINGTVATSPVRVYKTDDISVTNTGTSNVTLTLTDDQRYLKHGSIKGNIFIPVTAQNVAITTVQPAVIGYAEFVTLQCTITIGPRAQTASTTITAKKNVSGTTVGWGPFDISIYFMGGPYANYLTNPNSAFPASATGTFIETKQVSSSATTAPFSLSFNATGYYYYRIKETSASGGGWAIDAQEYLVEIYVEPNPLKVAATNYFTTRSGPTASWPSNTITTQFSGSFTFNFDNTFTRSNASTQLGVKKHVSATSGSVPDWSFGFTLRNSDLNGAAGGTLYETI